MIRQAVRSDAVKAVPLILQAITEPAATEFYLDTLSVSPRCQR